MTSSTGGGGNWPFERVGDEASPGVSGMVARSGATPERPVAPSGFSGPTPPEHAAGSGRSGGERGPAGTGGSGGSAGSGGSGGHGAGGPGTARRRRPPVWLLVVIGLVVVGAVVAVILALTNRQQAETPQAPPAETITLPVPTPTVTPIAREGGTAFQTALPSTVLAFAMSEVVEHEPLLVGGAVEGWKVTYTDGAQTVVLYAGQYRDAATADAAFEQVLAQNPIEAGAGGAGGAATETGDDAGDDAGDETATDDATDAPDAPAFEPEQGTVEVDGEQVGRFLFIPREDGTASLWWTNTTVLLQLEGPAAAVRDVYAAFPL